VHVRFFTPTMEVPVCGHATIAAHYAMACAEPESPPVRSLVHRTGAGLQRVRTFRDAAGASWRVEIEQGRPEFEPPLGESWRRRVAGALGVPGLAAGRPLQIVSTGHSKVMVPLPDEFPLEGLVPDLQALTAMSRELGCNGWFPFVLKGPQATEGRMFAPAIGIPEDPVTGNANGPLGAYLVRHALMRHDGRELAFDGHQGRALKRDGVVRVRVAVVGDTPAGVTIGGEAVVLFDAPLAKLAAQSP
jgi:PhzF family phenazine biosynthesis protein